MNRIWLFIVLSTLGCALHAQNISGNWQGTLPGNHPHRLMLQVVKTQSGGWEATLYRIDQAGEPELVPSVKVSDSELRLGLRDGGTYDGKVSVDATEIRGSWTGGHLPPQPVTFQRATKETAWEDLDSEVVPPVTAEDIQIVKRAKAILSSPAKWNRADNRECPTAAKTFSLYCALERATVETSGRFEHRGAAMQEARFVINDDLARGNHYEHRLMDYNNDPKTTFADTQKFFQLVEERIEKRLKNGTADTSK
jgi:hypothetical protein